jgi:hypothetical protein
MTLENKALQNFSLKLKLIFIAIISLGLIIECIFYNLNDNKKPVDGWWNKISNFLKEKESKSNYAEKIPVITYHMIISDSEKKLKKNYNESLCVSKTTFTQQMKWLYERGYKTLNCQELYLWHQRKIELPKKSLLITFDGGSIGQEKYAMPILKQYKMKGVTFILGVFALRNKKGKIKYKSIKKLRKLYPNFDFQSHTYNLHRKFKKNDYILTIKDAKMQKKYFKFFFLAYPFGIYSSGMIKAYKESGIKMAFTYGMNDYATRNQDIYKIKRIKISGNESFSYFVRWFKD